MVYVALLRGINVGGKNKVEMKRLAVVFEEAGMSSVKTYINTGNVVFSSTIRSRARLEALLEAAISSHFGLKIPVLVRDIKSVRAVVEAMPRHWTNDQTMKCDAMFLWKDIDQPSVLEKLDLRAEVDDARYVAGAVVWSVDRKNVTRSGMMQLAATPFYKRMTIRNCNTVRKLLQLMEDELN